MSMPPMKRKIPRFTGLVEELEPRILFNADAGAILAPIPWMPQDEPRAVVQQVLSAQNDTVAVSTPCAASVVRTELVFVDARVPDAKKLVEALVSQTDEQRDLEIHWLDANKDGVTQISDALQGRQNVAALHIISHGQDGAIQLGNTTLNGANLADHATSLSTWSQALTQDADLLIYGCDVAKTQIGQNFVDNLHILTGADVAASINVTGHRDLGGDWNLEFKEGDIESAVALTTPQRDQWREVLSVSAAGSETRANTTTSNPQQTSLLSGSQIASDASGNYVLVWEDTITDYVYARKYNADGTAATAEFQVNTDVTGARNKDQPTVSMDSSGNFVIAWRSELQDGGSYGIYAQRYNASAVAQGAEFLVNTTTANAQDRPAIAMYDSGFVITWTSSSQDGGLLGVYAQRYNASGVVQGAEFLVNTTTSNNQQGADIGMDASGNFVIAWSSNAQDGSLLGVYAQRYNASGVAQGSEFRINTTTSNDQELSSVSMNATGGFVVAWTSTSQDGSLDGAYARTYNSTGTAISAEILLNSTTTSYQRYPSVAINATGDFVAAWQSYSQDGSVYGIYTRQFSSAGTAITSESLVNTTTSNDQIVPSVTWSGTKLIISWSGNGTGDSDGVFFQRFTSNTSPVISSNSGGASASINVAENATAVTTVVASDGEGQTLTYSISGGVDAAKFTIDSSSGVLTFSTAPNYESPTDTGTNNVYDLIVQVSDGTATDTQTLVVTVTAVNESPIISSNGGGTSSSISVAETVSAVTTVVASDPEGTARIYSVSGTDAARFAINSSTGVLTFSAAPDYEAPLDSGGNNIYDIIVTASDGTLTDTQTLTITVTDVAATLVVDTTADTNDTGLGSSFTAEQLNATKGTDGKVSLREAMIAANTTAGTDTISFNISSGTAGTGNDTGAYVITTVSALPTIAGAVVIDASTQSGYVAGGLHTVVLDGNDAAAFGFDLNNASDGSTIRGFVIRNFTGYGIYVESGSDNQTIVGNNIGSFYADGSNKGVGFGNASYGIVTYGANTVIGGATAADRNVISGNPAGSNIYMATGADGTVIKGNYIGLNAAGTSVFSSTNPQWGVMIETNSSNITIGGTASGEGNIISGHTHEGIWVTTTGTVTIQGNYIGTDATGTVDLGNTRYGIYVDDSGTTTIGGTATGAGNLISGNDLGGVIAFNTSITVQGNIIGLNASGTAKLANTGAGIDIRTSSASTIGGNSTAARNVISGNTTYGIDVESSPTGGHIIKGNYIGVGSDGTTLLGNTSAGVYINAYYVKVGGKTLGDGNIIAGNGGAGIAVVGGTDSLFYRNSIYSNTGLGIDISNDGVSVNDVNDGDVGPNWTNNYPVITSVVTNGTSTTITGSFDWYQGGDTVYIELFSSTSKDASGYGEGKTYLGAVQVTTATTTADAAFSLTVTGVTVGDWITGVANCETSFLGASEFGMAVQAVAPASSPRGKVIWNVNDRYNQSYADWSTAGFGGVGNTGMNMTADISMIAAATAPTRNEVIFIGSADGNGKILAGVWNGSSWASVIALPLASPSATASLYDSFAIAYDQISGDAMLVWDNGNTGTTGLSYATWNGTSWSSTATITAPVSGEPVHMKLAANPIGHDMVLAVETTAASNNQYAVVWNGSSWGNSQTLGSNSSKQYFELNVEYEQLSGHAMVLYDASASASASIQYRVWNGSSWGSEGTVTAPVGVTASSELYCAVSATDKTSNRIAVAAKNADNDVWMAVWDGNAWGNTQVATTAGVLIGDYHPTMALAFETQSGDLLAVYGKNTGPNVFYRTWTSGGGWSAEGTGPSMGASDVPYIVKLYSDPYSNTIMMGAQDAASDLNFATWDGSAWGAVTELDAATAHTYRENFTYVWYQNAPVLSNLSGNTLAYTEGAAASVLDQGTAASVVMGDDTLYNGGNLTVSFTAGSTSGEDILAVRNQGTGAAQIGVSGANITYEGVSIGTYTGGSSGASLVITLNSSATDVAVTALIKNITYQNSNTGAPSTSNRTVRFVVTNAQGHASANNDMTVTVSEVNTAPTATITPATYSATEQTSLTLHGTGLSIADSDAGSATVQATLSVVSGTLTVSAGTTGVTVSNSGTSSVTLSGTLTQINNLLSGSLSGT
ncbi:MAG: DUF4347 domain-containing protein, partial [Aquabacterium sp.]|nr:DUF4347 domain-containing protein [Aquabacterium sp.]